MAYTTDDNIRYYIDSTGTQGIGTNVLGTYAVSLSQEWADSIIDMKCCKRYSVPFSPVPPAIKSLSTSLSSWNALRTIYTQEVPASIQQIKDNYDIAIKMLDDIWNGDMDIPSGTAGANVTEAGAGTKYWSSNMNYTPTFDVDDELLWRTDTDRLSDIAAGRG